jgi:3-oxoadipate enol-lactonase
MPDIKVDDGCVIHVEVEGPERAPVLMLSNSLGTNLHMWDEQVGPFTRHFRLVRYDRRGHGKSSVPNGPYTMERLGRDVVAVLDGLGIQKINWCGLSMGGMVGMWLGAHAANRVDKLILSNTSSFFPDKSIWDGRIKFVRDKGLEGIVDANMERWFTAGFRERSQSAMEKMREMFLATKVDGYVGCGDPRHGPPAVAAKHNRADLGDCRAAGSGDDARSRRIHQAAHPRRQDRRTGGRAYLQSRTAAGLRRDRVGIFVGEVTSRSTLRASRRDRTSDNVACDVVTRRA